MRGVGKILLEPEYCSRCARTPGIDRLVIVTHHERGNLLAREQADPGILDRVGILELVHQDVAEALLIVCQQFLTVTPQLQGP